MNLSTSPGSSAGISAWSIQCVPTPRTFRGHASGLIDPVSVPLNSISVYSSRVCSEGRVMPHPLADLEVLPGAEPAGGGAEFLGPVLETGQVVVAFDLVAELDQPDAALFQHQRVVVPLVPALEVQLCPGSSCTTSIPSVLE